MNLVLHAVNVLNSILPVRELFGIRRLLANQGGIVVGEGTRITHGVKFYDRYITIGKSVWIGMDTVLASTGKGRITIGDNVDIAPCCRIVSGTHELGGENRRAGAGSGQDITIGSGSWLGTACCVLAGANIGEGTVVAAGSVILAGIYPPNVLLAGVPARIKRTLPQGMDA